jgi:hypothetical protein
MVEEKRRQTSSIDSSFPVELPYNSSLFLSENEFNSYLFKVFSKLKEGKNEKKAHDQLAKLELDEKAGSSFVNALKSATALPKLPPVVQKLAENNRMLTENGDVTHISTESPLLDLFVELEKVIDGQRLETLLQAAMKEDPLASLKIIWNARSIHLGKGEQESFYKCLGWLKDEHPLTVLLNLQWLYRGVIEKKVKKKKDDDDDDIVIVREGINDDDETVIVEEDNPDILHGVSHGYWKDLLNILILDTNQQLQAQGLPRQILHKKSAPWARRDNKRKRETDEPKIKLTQEQSQKIAKDSKHELERTRHSIAIARLQDPFYHALHSIVARLFAKQLKLDKANLEKGSKEHLAKISLAAKWAPSLEGFHDKQTFIASSIAEILFPPDNFSPDMSRELYLRHAREAYRAKYLSPLRKRLDIVERKISQEEFDQINYSKIPSLAMNMHKDLFIKKDMKHYEQYIAKLAEGKATISGAILNPAVLVQQALRQVPTLSDRKDLSVARLVESKKSELLEKTLDGQWATLVQRIKDNGTLSSTMAVCDVSGSMTSPTFPDTTTPLHSSIGLSLLVSEVTEKPFGGSIITFSTNPSIREVGGADDKSSLREKCQKILGLEWGMSTDFVAVFERLILPVAVQNNVKPEDMVKQVIVFSDMQFDAASYSPTSTFGLRIWETSYGRIKKKYQDAGYEMPILIFWNLAGGRNRSAPKPVTYDELNTIMVSGYSQAMLKMFLDNGSFEEVEEIEEVTVDESGNVEVKQVKRVDLMAGLWKAISQKAYDMLKVYD